MNPLRFSGMLDDEDRLHLGRLLDASIPAGSAAGGMRLGAAVFLETRVWAGEEVAAALGRTGRRERERMLSELVWRVTCHLDESVTRVLGVEAVPLGYGFRLLITVQEGREHFLVGWEED
jgi:hypothetical protein